MALLTRLQPGSQALQRSAAEQRLAGLAGWHIEPRQDGALSLRKTFGTRNFLQAMELAERLTTLAEAEDHHPHLGISWGSLTVSWWTHSLGGLHENDFIIAAETDRIIAAYFQTAP